MTTETTAKTTVHPVDGLPDIYAVVEHQGGSGLRFIPTLHDQALATLDGSVAWESTLKEAVQSLYEFVGRMQ